MNTTIQQQMAAVKVSMKQFEEYAEPSNLLKFQQTNKHWQALNDAYSTLAAVALTSNRKPITGNTVAETKRFTRKDLY